MQMAEMAAERVALRREMDEHRDRVAEHHERLGRYEGHLRDEISRLETNMGLVDRQLQAEDHKLLERIRKLRVQLHDVEFALRPSRRGESTP